MDPNANLADQRTQCLLINELNDKIAELVDEVADGKPDDLCSTCHLSRRIAKLRASVGRAADRLAELVDALDKWIVDRGAMPDEWADGANNR